MLIQNATADVLASRRHHERELAERNRFRKLVAAIDESVAACEETHLLGIKKCPADLKQRQKTVLVQAQRAVSGSGNAEAIAIVEEQAAREVRKVTDVMDTLWIVQEVIFDLMQPWRSERQDAGQTEALAPAFRRPRTPTFSLPQTG
jgi:hypothetical protein